MGTPQAHGSLSPTGLLLLPGSRSPTGLLRNSAGQPEPHGPTAPPRQPEPHGPTAPPRQPQRPGNTNTQASSAVIKLATARHAGTNLDGPARPRPRLGARDGSPKGIKPCNRRDLPAGSTGARPAARPGRHL